MVSDIVSSIAVSVLEVPFDKPIRSALGTYIGSDYVVVELRTESGNTGLGYSTSLDRRGTKAVVLYQDRSDTPRDRARRDPTIGSLATDVVSQ